MSQVLDFLSECESKGVLEKLCTMRLLKPTARRHVNIYFKYNAYRRSGQNVNGSVYLTARMFNVSEPMVYYVIRNIEQILEGNTCEADS